MRNRGKMKLDVDIADKGCGPSFAESGRLQVILHLLMDIDVTLPRATNGQV